MTEWHIKGSYTPGHNNTPSNCEICGIEVQEENVPTISCLEEWEEGGVGYTGAEKWACRPCAEKLYRGN